MKRRTEKIFVFAVLAAMVMASGCGNADKQVFTGETAATEAASGQTESEAEATEAALVQAESEAEVTEAASVRAETWDDRVASAILSENQGRYMGEECVAEGHRILDMETDGSETRLYALTMYGEYQFQNDNFVKAGGTGVFPVVLVFEGDEDSGYTLRSYEVPEDGGGYLESIRRMFPEALQETCISPPDEAREDLESQERRYAAGYLEKLGRTAPIGSYRDFEHRILTEAGVSVEVSNDLVENRELGYYPLWIGTLERIEDGVRYVYRQDYDPEKKKILFTKTEYDSGTVVEAHAFDSETGEEER